MGFSVCVLKIQFEQMQKGHEKAADKGCAFQHNLHSVFYDNQYIYVLEVFCWRHGTEYVLPTGINER